MNGTFCSLARSVILALALGSAAAPALAKDADQEGLAPHQEIQIGGIDLTTPEGFIQARKRVSNAARAVCQNATDIDGFHIEKTACIHTARAQGTQQLAMLQQQALAAAALKTERYAARDTATPRHLPN